MEPREMGTVTNWQEGRKEGMKILGRKISKRCPVLAIIIVIALAFPPGGGGTEPLLAT
jgi:hypothetical protein